MDWGGREVGSSLPSMHARSTHMHGVMGHWSRLTCMGVEGGLCSAQRVQVLPCLCVYQGVLGSSVAGVHTSPASPPRRLLEELQQA